MNNEMGNIIIKGKLYKKYRKEVRILTLTREK